MRPRLLDLFSCAGGAGTGYHRAGFDVVGVDLEPQPDYPFPFIQADALVVLGGMVARSKGWRTTAGDVGHFDAIHASPPCQGYTGMGNRNPATKDKHPQLIPAVRRCLLELGVPYVIENVVGARRELDHPIVICGRALGLGVARHRLFELGGFSCFSTECACRGDELPVYGKLDGRRLWTRTNGSELRAAKTLEEAQAAMGMDWTDWDHLREAIPPAYTNHIGDALMAHLSLEAAA